MVWLSLFSNKSKYQKKALSLSHSQLVLNQSRKKHIDMYISSLYKDLFVQVSDFRFRWASLCKSWSQRHCILICTQHLNTSDVKLMYLYLDDNTLGDEICRYTIKVHHQDVLGNVVSLIKTVIFCGFLFNVFFLFFCSLTQTPFIVYISKY